MPLSQYWHPDQDTTVSLLIAVAGNAAIIILLCATESKFCIILIACLSTVVLLLLSHPLQALQNTPEEERAIVGWFSANTPAAFDVVVVGTMGIMATTFVALCSLWGEEMNGELAPGSAMLTSGAMICFTLMSALKGIEF